MGFSWWIGGALRRVRAAIGAALVMALMWTGASTAAQSIAEAPLDVGNRTIHVFRAPLGAFSPQERADGARQRVAKAFEGSGSGWTSVKSSDQGFMVLLDGQPMFTVASGDARNLAGETPEDLANKASRLLQTAWAEARERRDPRAAGLALIKVTLGALMLALILAVVFWTAQRGRVAMAARFLKQSPSLTAAGLGTRVAAILMGTASRGFVALAWILSLLAIFVFLGYGLEQFAHTRSIGEGLAQSLALLLTQILHAAAGAIPGMIIAALIFLAAWIATQVSSEIFTHLASGQVKLGMLDAHTAPATRRITNASLWLFALAMAYPYLPGAQTEAFKGLSVILGLMVSIGASGLVGQIASGVILAYTRALLLGEYVRIQDCEGTVTELGLFVTRLRTGHGEEVALPNALVLANVTRNFSRVRQGRGFVLDTTITIGYDVPWRQIHAMLLEAAGQVAEIGREPPPYVVQSALSDFYVAYRLIVYVGTDKPAERARVTSDLHAAIQDVFNRHGVQIMSPHYYADPQQPKWVPESNWYAPPAKRMPDPGNGSQRGPQ